MPSKMRHGLLISLVVVSLVVLWFGNSHAETVNYFYDELNHLKRVEYEDDLGNVGSKTT
jgi:acyl dehydratase